MTSSLKVLQVRDDRVEHLISKSPSRVSPGKLKRRVKKSKSKFSITVGHSKLYSNNFHFLAIFLFDFFLARVEFCQPIENILVEFLLTSLLLDLSLFLSLFGSFLKRLRL